jgi:hypothetical protein
MVGAPGYQNPAIPARGQGRAFVVPFDIKPDIQRLPTAVPMYQNDFLASVPGGQFAAGLTTTRPAR